MIKALQSSPDMVPTGLQSRGEIFRRRLLVALLNLITMAGFGLWLVQILSPADYGVSAWSWVDSAIVCAFMLAVPWTVLGFWNAMIGLWLLHGTSDGLRKVAPYLEVGDRGKPLRLPTAILMTLRNEDPARAFARLHVIKESLDATNEGASFSFFVLSDSDQPAIIAREEALFAAWKGMAERPESLVYRRRIKNNGYKAGNIADFCDRWGHDYAFLLPLDADSVMDGQTICRMIRIMQDTPKLGILQSLVVGAPSDSAFARIFQFGMRHGMRSYTMGQAWWAADCGPFWGHNAVLRTAPFMDHCGLPALSGSPPFGGPILSHDQVEAVLMRKAGFEVRVLPVEVGSYEDNPPTVLEFTRRDLRWCQGNLQYLRLLNWPGLLPTSRFQLIWAILMFIGLPGFVATIALIAYKAYQFDPDLAFNSAAAWGFYGVFLIASLAPKWAGLIDIAMQPRELTRYGGARLFWLGGFYETVFGFLLGGITTVGTSLFMLGLLFGRSVIWSGQLRDAHHLSWKTAFLGLWPQTVFGLVVTGVLAFSNMTLLLASLPLTAGYLLAIPFAVFTARPAFGVWLKQQGLFALPEERNQPDILRELDGLLNRRR
jgi:membrane glycosyltransferase